MVFENPHPIADVGATIAVFGGLLDWFPLSKIALLVGLIWYSLLIYDWIEGRVRGRKPPHDAH